MLQDMVAGAGLTAGDYIAILPMASEDDSAYYFAAKQFIGIAPCKAVAIVIGPQTARLRPTLLDSLRKAKLIYLCGGDQNRLMDSIGTRTDAPVRLAIKDAYQKGATIAGTSAGAAVMSHIMLTGDETYEPEYESTYARVWKGNARYAQGLGLLDSTIIIDQHFIVRSRYNRLFSALLEHPAHTCIGIDEATALVVHGDSATVVGESQIVVMRRPIGIVLQDTVHWKLEDLHLSLFPAGTRFPLIE